MRIVLFTESFLPVVNGVSTSVLTQAEYLTACGHECVVVAPRFPGHMDLRGDFRVIRIPSWRTPLNPENPFAYPPPFGGIGILKREKFDIVHTHHPFGLGMHGRLLARQLGVPLVSTFHTLYMQYAHYVPFLPQKALVRLIERHLRWYYSSCNRVIAPSMESVGRLVQIGVPENLLTVVATGVSDAEPVDSRTIQAIRRQYDLPEGVPVLLFVGRIAREKNLEFLLTAFNRLCKLNRGDRSGKAPILVIAGDGPFRSALVEQARYLQINDMVRFTGFLNHANLSPLYALASLFVFPSASETQGVVICEAMSFGLPCIVVKGGGAPEFVRNGVDGFVVDADPDIFAEAVERLLGQHDQREAFGHAARATPLRLTPEGMIDRVLGIYEAEKTKRASR